MCSILFDHLCSNVVRVLLLFFFFQAEDGIRDLVRSRGLGDVYKRQATIFLIGFVATTFSSILGVWHGVSLLFADFVRNPVSYTHLTLPTSDLV